MHKFGIKPYRRRGRKWRGKRKISVTYPNLLLGVVLEKVGSRISRSHPGCPWENGYQESFYGKFKVDFADPNRFESLGKLVAEIYLALWVYNHTRIHSVLRMPPEVFAEKIAELKNGEFLPLNPV